MTAIQLNFTLRTSTKCKSVHLVGSWDGYKSNMPLTKDTSRDGGWKGSFRFSSPMMVPGGRYWYYYIIDGNHVSHDPAREHTIEPTTGRKLNILNIPLVKGSGGSGGHGHHSSSSKHGHHGAKGRSLSPSQIAHPYPSRPYETQVFRSEKYSSREMEALSRRYAAQRLGSDSSSSDSDSPSRFSPTYSSRSSYNSSPSSVSSLGSPITPFTPTLPQGNYAAFACSGATPIGLGITNASAMCTCERYAVMRDGRRMRVDCGGKVCGHSGSECSEEDSSDSSSEDERRSKHRHHSRSKKSSKSHHSSRGIKGLFGRR